MIATMLNSLNALFGFLSAPSMAGAVIPRWLPWWLFCLIIVPLGASVILLYKRDRRVLSRPKGWLLTAQRVLLFLLLAALLLDLARVRTESRRRASEVLVFIDASLSMSLEDDHKSREQSEEEARALGLATVRGMRRLDLARRALSSGWLDELGARYRFSLFALAGKASRLGEPREGAAGLAEALRALETLEPDGSRTDLARPVLVEAFERTRDRLAGILLFSDGNHSAAGDPEDAARDLALAGVPIVAIGTGAREGPRDAALLPVESPGKVFSGDEVEIEVAVEAVGMGALSLPVTVREGSREVARATVELRAEDGVTRHPLSLSAGNPGRRKFSVSFPEQKGEATAANNQADFWLEVAGGEIRALYLDRGPRWEYHYLRSSWEQDEKIELDAFLVTRPPDRRLPPKFPRGRDELFSYDVVVLGDVDAELFSPEERALFADFVTARGGTLVLVSGERGMPYAWSGTALEPIVPVKLLSPPPPPALGVQLARAAPRILLSAKGEGSDVFRLTAGRTRNLDLWRLLPGPLWINPVREAKSGSIVLAEVEVTDWASHPFRAKEPGEGRPATSADSRVRVPVFVSRPMGGGKVFYSGVDSTWKWRLRFGDLFYRKFWGQVVRWAVADRLGASDEYVRLGTDKVIYTFPEHVTIQARIEAPGKRPLETGLVDAVVRVEKVVREGAGSSAAPADPRPREWRVPLEPIPESGGRFRGVLSEETLRGVAGAAGDAADVTISLECSLRLEIADISEYSGVETPATVAFAIAIPPQRERLALSCDRTLLEEMARLSGGAYLPFAEFRKAADALPDRTTTEETTAVTAVLDFPLLVAGLVVGLVALEWILRKIWHLI